MSLTRVAVLLSLAACSSPLETRAEVLAASDEPMMLADDYPGCAFTLRMDGQRVALEAVNRGTGMVHVIKVDAIGSRPEAYQEAVQKAAIAAASAVGCADTLVIKGVPDRSVVRGIDGRR